MFSHASSRRVASLALALCALLALSPVQAQDPLSDFFGGLFGHRGHPPAPPPGAGEPRVRRIMPHRENRPPTYWHKQSEKPRRAPRKTEDAAASAAKEAPVAAQQTYFVAMLGDTLGILVGAGLRGAVADRPEIGVVDKAKENSGLVRDDYFDWVKAAREIAAGPQKLNVAVIMIGSNDRQSIHRGAESFEPLSDKWKEIYVARVDAVIGAFKEKNIPLVWVGLPVMKNERFSADMQKLNEIFRERVARAGQRYVDLWENLADEKGQYSAFGPDINGEIVKLRTLDGVHLTEAGARSVAHFVDAEVKKFYEAGKAPPAATKPETSAAQPAAPAQPLVFRPPVSGPTAAPALPDRPAVGPVQSLAASAFERDADLARRNAPAPASDAASSRTLVKHVLVDGGDQPARPNRADDSSWRAPPAPQ